LKFFCSDIEYNSAFFQTHNSNVATMPCYSGRCCKSLLQVSAVLRRPAVRHLRENNER